MCVLIYWKERDKFIKCDNPDQSMNSKRSCHRPNILNLFRSYKKIRPIRLLSRLRKIQNSFRNFRTHTLWSKVWTIVFCKVPDFHKGPLFACIVYSITGQFNDFFKGYYKLFPTPYHDKPARVVKNLSKPYNKTYSDIFKLYVTQLRRKLSTEVSFFSRGTLIDNRNISSTRF